MSTTGKVTVDPETVDPGASLMLALVRSEPRFAESYDRLATRPWPFGVPVAEGSPVRQLHAGLVAIVEGRIDDARFIADSMPLQRDGAVAFVITSLPYQATSGEQLAEPWVSALPQGLALSLFDHLARLTDDDSYRSTATELAKAYLVPVGDGGFTRFGDDGAQFAQYPTSSPTIDFAGGATALLALADYTAATVDDDLAALASDAIRWWEANIDQFGVAARAFDADIEAPAFALSAGPRQDLLFRLSGPSTIDVATISVEADGFEPVVGTFGTEGDGADGTPVQLLIDDVHHNWTEAVEVSGVPTRRIEPQAGSDDQAPFRVSTPWRALDGAVEIVVEAQVEGPEPAMLEVFDGEQYLILSELSPSTGIEQYSAAVPDVVFKSGTSDLDDSARFAGIVTLTGLLAQVSGGHAIEAAFERWSPSTSLQPGLFDPRALPGVELDLGNDPVLPIEPGVDSVHVEYPAIDQVGDEFTMLYSAYGDGNLWQIRGATSTDEGITWMNRRDVIDSELLGYGGAAFPDMVRVDDGNRVVVVFSADRIEPQGYDSIMVATGPSIDELDTPIIAAEVGGLDPAIWLEGGQFHMSFTLVSSPDTTIEHYVSDDAITWTRLDPLYTGRIGVYTQNTFVVDGHRLWVLNIRQSRRSTYLFCRASESDTLIPVPGGEVGVTDTALPIWNQYRYGLEVITIGDEMVSFHNGIRLDDGDGNGMVGRTRLDLSRVEVPETCS